MNKFILPSLIVSVFSTPIFAMDTELFFGAGLGYQHDELDGIAYQIKEGAILNNQHRITLEYNYSDFKSDIKNQKMTQHLFLSSYDYLYPVAKNINIFAGLTMGATSAKYTNQDNSTLSTDFVWGGQVGVEYDITQQLSTSLTYRNLDNPNYEYEGLDGFFTQQVMFGISYKFMDNKKHPAQYPVVASTPAIEQVVVGPMVKPMVKPMVESTIEPIPKETVVIQTSVVKSNKYLVQVFAGQRVLKALTKGKVLNTNEYVDCSQLKLNVEFNNNMFKIVSDPMSFGEALQFKKIAIKECQIDDAFIKNSTN